MSVKKCKAVKHKKKRTSIIEVPSEMLLYQCFNSNHTVFFLLVFINLRDYQIVL